MDQRKKKQNSYSLTNDEKTFSREKIKGGNSEFF